MILFKKNILLILILIFFSSCGLYKYSPVDENPINDAEKREKNIKEGQGIKIGGGSGSGKFEFASSNEMWRATIQILDFVPLTNADYGGGIVITDWYSEDETLSEAIKISVQFLSNEIRVDGLNINVYKKNCNANQTCKVQKIDGEINQELKMAILTRAAEIRNADGKKRAEESDYCITPSKGDKKKKINFGKI